MRFPRFHLSTLALCCVLIGAIIGLYLRSNIWQLERSSYVDPNWGIQPEPGFGWLNSESFQYRGTAIAPDTHEQAIVTRSLAKNTSTVCFVTPVGRDDFRTLEDLPIDSSFVAMRFSPDGKYFAVWLTNRLDIYRRTRAYGWQGFLQLPLFWVASVCVVSLCVTPIRRLLRRKTSTRDLSAATPVT